MATTFNTALGRGYSVMYCLEVEGIPYLFVEQKPWRATADAVPTIPTKFAAATGGGIVAGLVIDGERIGEEIDREKGVSKARPLTFRLAYTPLDGEGVLDDLFARPSKYSTLNADVDSAATSFVAVSPGGGWTAGGIYVGNEYMFAGSVSTGSTTTFSSITRGLWGGKYDHKKIGFTGSQWVTDRPNFWRGRMVTLWECLVDPEGRAVFDTWLDGDYCRQTFKGFLDTTPLPTNVGFQFTARSITRKLTQEMGFKGIWKSAVVMAPGSGGSNAQTAEDTSGEKYHLLPMLYDGGNFSVYFDMLFSDSDTFTGDIQATTSGKLYQTIAAWSYDLSAALTTASATVENPKQYSQISKAIVAFDVADDNSGVTIKDQSYASTNTGDCPYFLRPDFDSYIETKAGASDGSGGYFKLSPNWDWGTDDVKPWLVLHNEEADTFQDYTLPTAGYMVVEDIYNAGPVELLKFADGVAAGDAQLNYQAIRVTERKLNNTTVNLASSLKCTLVSGAIGNLDYAMLTLLESSSTGERGDHDTLGYGMGYNIDDGHIDTTAIAEMVYSKENVVAVDDGRSSFVDSLGGWIISCRECLCSIRNSSGVMQLKPVKHEVYELSTIDPTVLTITAADVLVDGLSPVAVVNAPNQIQISTESFLGDGFDLVVRSIPEMIREGTHTWELECPAMEKHIAYEAAKNLIVLGAGQYALNLTLGPWVDIQPGDSCLISLASHYGMFDFTDGTLGVSSVAARCLGVERDLVSMKQECRFLLYGHTLPGSIYCPTLAVTATGGGATVEFSTADVGWLQEDMLVTIFNPGRESLGTPETAEVTVDDINGIVVTLSSRPAWVAGGTTKVTWARYSTASAEQRKFFFFSSAYRWN